MKISNKKTVLIEKFLQGRMKPSERLLFEARMIVDHELNERVSLQRATYSVIKIFSRRKLKQEIESIHKELFQSPDRLDFQQNILKLFKS